MRDFKSFIKRTWWLFLILFIAPVIVISVFAIKEYCFHQINLSAGEWAGLFGSTFGYWGATLLGVLAFWQNERVNQMNEKLLKNEMARTAPKFQFLWGAASSDIKFTITNVSANTASNVIISDLSFDVIENEEIVSTDVYRLKNVSRKDFLAPMENADVVFAGNPLHGKMFAQNQTGRMSVDIKATDAYGICRNTQVQIVGREYGNSKLKYTYIDTIQEEQTND